MCVCVHVGGGGGRGEGAVGSDVSGTSGVNVLY